MIMTRCSNRRQTIKKSCLSVVMYHTYMHKSFKLHYPYSPWSRFRDRVQCIRYHAIAIDSALNYVTSKKQQEQGQHQQKKHLSLDSASDDNNNDSDNQLTATGNRQTVF